jgi:hypothetical protein
MVLILDGVKQRTEAQVSARSVPTGYGYGRPSLVKAYGLPSASTERNVAVVDAYNDPNAASDLATYRRPGACPPARRQPRLAA